MNRLTIPVILESVDHAEASGSIQFYRVAAAMPDAPHGALFMYAGPAIGRHLYAHIHERAGDVVHIEIEPGPLGLRIVSVCVDRVCE